MRAGIAALFVLTVVACSSGGGDACVELGGTVTGSLAGTTPAAQVMIEARFIGVEDGFAANVGIDFDLVLSAPPATAAPGARIGNGGDLVAAFDVVGGGDGASYFVPAGHRADSFLPLAIPQFVSPFDETAVFPMAFDAFGTCILLPQGSFVTPTNVQQDFALSNLAPSPSNPLDFQATVLDDLQRDALLMEIAADPDRALVTAPSILALSGQRAMITTYTTQLQLVDFDPAFANAMQSVDPLQAFANSGISIDIRTVVNSDNTVTLRIRPVQVATFRPGLPFDIGGDASAIEVPVARDRAIETMVTVPDGSTLLLGGQRLATETQFTQGVPILADLPVLGELFQPFSPIQPQHDLLLLVTPRIILQAE